MKTGESSFPIIAVSNLDQSSDMGRYTNVRFTYRSYRYLIGFEMDIEFLSRIA